LHPDAVLYFNSGEVVGFVGRIHPNLAKIYEICDETIVAQLDAMRLSGSCRM
jgi:phenylalanyl-tRNA synthetase beta subunit